MTWSDDLAELERWFTLTPTDMAIVLGARGQPQRLERALMLTWMRAERTLVSDVQGLPSPIIIYVAEQLHLTSAVLKGYRSHQQTRSVAAEAIREHLEVRTCTSADRQRLHGMLCEKVAHTGNTTALIQAAEDWLKEHHILKPTGETTIERLVYAARAEAEDRLFAQIAAHLSPEQQASLDAVCAPGTHDSQLAGFVKPPRNASAPAIVEECQRLKDMRTVLIDAVDWGTITMNRLRQWAAVVRRLSAQALRRLCA